jgi:hypothetical protein
VTTTTTDSDGGIVGETSGIAARAGALLARVHRPEYTGENRCIPCTAANAVVLAGATAATWAFVAPAAAVGVAGVGTAAIALRGYLVPGTPTLTKRYFPDWVLAAFEKDGPRAFTTESGEFDVAGVLAAADAFVDDPDGDVTVAPDFDDAWRAEMAGVDDERAAARALGELSKLDPERLSFDAQGVAFAAWYDGDWVGQWPSRAAFVADVAAARVLADRVPEWRTLPVASRSEVAAGLRVLLERCPTCDGLVELGTNVQQSCCRKYEVVAATCRDCDARVFELPTDGLAEPPSA